MVRHQQSTEVTKTAPKRGPSLISLGARTKGWDKNPPRRDCPYGIFGKKMQRSILGFGSLATAIYSRELITEAALYESHGSALNKSESRHFQQRVQYHQDNRTIEYSTMCRAVEALFARFPDIQRDITQAKQTSLIKKIRLVMAGAHVARNADVNLIRRQIFVLSNKDAKKRGWEMPVTMEKSDCGIKSEPTARFLLPFAERDKYLKDPSAYREGVERNQIKLSLSGTWPAILYDEDMAEDDNEFAGLFRSETLLRCGITILCSPSAGERWKYPQPGARTFASSQKESNAEINGITKITPEAIAYFSTLAVFAVHDGSYYVRDLGAIDLSELYHDVVTALRTKTEWASKTLKFWNKIIFGDREEEESEPKISRADRFKKLEVAQRKREGLPEPNARPPETSQTPRRQPAHNLPPPPDLEDEDEPASPKTTPQLKANPRKRQIIAPDSDSDSGPDEDKDHPDNENNSNKEGSSGDEGGNNGKDDNGNEDNEVEVDKDEGNGHNSDEDETVAPRPPKKKQRLSNGQGSRLTTPQSSAGKKKQAVDAGASQLSGDEEEVGHVDVVEWGYVCKDFKDAIKYAEAAGLKEVCAEFARVTSMSAEKGTHYVNANYERLEWLKLNAEKMYKAIQAMESAPLEDEEPAPEPSAPKKKDPTPKRPVAKKAGAAAQKNTKAKPPPRVTRSITAAAERFRKEAQAQARDEFNPRTNLEKPATPTNVRSVREKLPVGATPSLRRR